jgi:outer membrane protein OmpA-like peptidoglycan-associated protein
MPLPDKFEYVGIALYKESDNYSEFIQGKLITPLIKGKKYCLRTSVNLCSYSRYSGNRLAFYFSSSPVSVNSKNEYTYLPQVTFSNLPVENKSFMTLCDYFIADGGEQTITVGRFSKPENLELIKRENIPQSSFGLELAVYYLIDNIELFEIQDTLECYCKRNIIPIDSIKTKPRELYETDLNKLKQGVPVVLENVNFEFDSFILLNSSEDILNILLNYLNNNPDTRISIEGHTDDIGTEDYNLKLSINRARSVYNWLINEGVDSSRLSFTGFGNSRPLYNDTEEKHRALNRRVEVRIIKN